MHKRSNLTKEQVAKYNARAREKYARDRAQEREEAAAQAAAQALRDEQAAREREALEQAAAQATQTAAEKAEKKRLATNARARKHRAKKKAEKEAAAQAEEDKRRAEEKKVHLTLQMVESVRASRQGKELHQEDDSLNMTSFVNDDNDTVHFKLKKFCGHHNCFLFTLPIHEPKSYRILEEAGVLFAVQNHTFETVTIIEHLESLFDCDVKEMTRFMSWGDHFFFCEENGGTTPEIHNNDQYNVYAFLDGASLSIFGEEFTKNATILNLTQKVKSVVRCLNPQVLDVLGDRMGQDFHCNLNQKIATVATVAAGAADQILSASLEHKTASLEPETVSRQHKRSGAAGAADQVYVEQHE